MKDLNFSAKKLRSAIAQKMPVTEIASDREVRDLLRALAISIGNLHSDHYYRISHREDVILHRDQFSPLYLSLHHSARVWLINGDASFFHENAHSERGWIPLDVKDSDLISCGTGAGQRLNVWEFVTEEGLLRHPDGTSPTSSSGFCFTRYRQVSGHHLSSKY